MNKLIFRNLGGPLSGLIMFVFCQTLLAAGPGYRVGDVVVDIPALDQNGAAVSVHDYAGQVLVLHFCGLYCAPCRDYATTLPSSISNLDSLVGPDKYEILEVLFLGLDAGPSTQASAQTWASFSGPAATILHADGDSNAGIIQAFTDFELNATPSHVVVDPALRIVQIDTSSGSSFDMVTAVQAARSAFDAPSAPQAKPDIYLAIPGVTLDVNAADGVLANDFDPNADPLEAQLVTTTSHGPLTLNADGSFIYGVPSDFTGDSFTYHAFATDGTSSEVTVTIDLGDAVVANDDFFDVPSDFPYEIRPGLDGKFRGLWENDFSLDGGLLIGDGVAGTDNIFIPAGHTFTDTAHGKVRMNGEDHFVYIPDPGYRGPDSFQYRIRKDGGTVTDTATVILQVSERPTLRAAINFSIIPGEFNEVWNPLVDEALSFYLSFPDSYYVDANPSGRPLTLYVVSPPATGTLNFNPDGSFTYDPEPGFADQQGVSFWIQAHDGVGTSDPRRVELRPSQFVYVHNDAYATQATDTLVVPAETGVLTNDVEPDGLPIEILGFGIADLYAEAGQELTMPSGATLTVASNGSLTYAPPQPPGPAFSELFFYDVDRVPGSINGFWSAAVLINVGGIANLPPMADAGGPYVVETGASILLDGSGSSDPEMDTLTFSWSASAGGFDDNASTSPIFTAPQNVTPITMTLTVDDGKGGTNSNTVEVLVFGDGLLDDVFHSGFE